MAHISLCNNYKECWKLGYCVSGNSFGRVRLQGFYAFPLVVYVALCCATLLPAAFQFQLPTALLPVETLLRKDLIQWPGLPFRSVGCFLWKCAQNILSI